MTVQLNECLADLPAHHAPGHPNVCGCCQKTRTDPEQLAMFGTLTDAGGKTWDICGKCIQVMWRKRAPKPDPLV